MRMCRPLHEDVPGPREVVRVTQPGLFGEGADDRTDVLEVLGARDAETMLGAHLEQNVDERARLEVVTAEPFVEDVEDGQQPLLGRVAPSPRFRFQPPARPTNAKIRELEDGFASDTSDYDLVCECGQEGCGERVAVPTTLYDEARRDGERLLVARGHERPDRERIVAKHPSFTVVAPAEARPAAPLRMAAAETG